MAQVLVTGASGFLGSSLVRQLYLNGADVVATGRNAKKLNALPLPNHAKIAVDLSDARALKTSLARLGAITTIVHCAALSSPWGRYDAFHEANVTATENVIHLARNLGVSHIIHISTPALYFRFEDQSLVPESAALPKPINAYAKTKALAEDRMRACGIATTILRPRGIYGAGDKALLPRLLRAAHAGPLPLFRGGEAMTDITHVSDVVSAIQAVMAQRDRAKGKTFNISGGTPLRIKTLVEQVCAAQDIAVRWRALPVWPALAAVLLGETIARLRPSQPEPRVTAYGLGIFAFSQSLDLSAARDTLGWYPRVSFDDGLAMTFSTKGQTHA
ncbi:MAG: NAD-dependent epimerase/dehydratase family protein [Sulfitobacter sp.]